MNLSPSPSQKLLAVWGEGYKGETNLEGEKTVLDKDEKQRIANEIAAQMGGYNRLDAMTGARFFIALDGGGLAFQFRGSKTFNAINIYLASDDTYTVKFTKFRGAEIKDTKEFTQIYSDALKPLFERQTGLYLSL